MTTRSDFKLPRNIFFVLILISLVEFSRAAPPSSYYTSATKLLEEPLKVALHNIIDNHTVISYSQTDEVMRVIDEAEEDTQNIDIIYSAFSMSKGVLGSSGVSVWNREHLWPRSYGISSSGADNSDLHNLFPCNASVNSSRGNKYYDETDQTGMPNSVSPENTFDDDSWEPSDEDKGKIARATFYMAVRYDGSDQATTDLVLSNSPNPSSSEMGSLTTLLSWNRNFPPKEDELTRNDSIFTGVETTAGFLKQGNRNPFIDYPELADAAFLGVDILTWHKWLWQSFTPSQLQDDLISSPLSDPDLDGYVNLLEFTANSDPIDGNSTPKYSIQVQGNNVFLTFSMVKNLALSGYTATWENTNSLGTDSWIPDTIAPVTIEDEGITTKESISFPVDSNRRFWRLRITHTQE